MRDDLDDEDDAGANIRDSVDDGKCDRMDCADSILVVFSLFPLQVRKVCTFKVRTSCPSYKDDIPNVRRRMVITQLALLNRPTEISHPSKAHS